MAGKKENLQKNLEISNNLLQMYGIKLNRHKTTVMAVETSHEANSYMYIYLENIKIQRVNTVHYLGVESQINGE